MSVRSERPWLARGERHQREGRPVDALVCYREALAADGHSSAAQFHLGELLRDLGRDSDAFAAWHAALTLEPRHVPALLAFGAETLRIGKRSDARAIGPRRSIVLFAISMAPAKLSAITRSPSS